MIVFFRVVMQHGRLIPADASTWPIRRYQIAVAKYGSLRVGIQRDDLCQKLTPAATVFLINQQTLFGVLFTIQEQAFRHRCC